MNTWVKGLFQTTSLLSQGRGNAADIPASPDPTCGITPGMLLLESLWEDKGLGVIFPFIYFVIMGDYYTLCVVYYYINMLPFRTKKFKVGMRYRVHRWNFDELNTFSVRFFIC